MNVNEILDWLREQDEKRLQELWQWADSVRRESVGDEVHLRGLVEISNHCVRQCGYCGLRAANRKLDRYRMTGEEILACGLEAKAYGYGTVVLQAGEDDGIEAGRLARIIRQIKEATHLAVTLSLGERSDEELKVWRDAGGDRYLLRFETSDPGLYRRIHPSGPGRSSNRLELLEKLKAMGYEIGSGVMIGIPGQTYTSLAEDILLFRRLDLDMIGVGPYIPHPETPLGRGKWVRAIPEEEQVPDTEEMTYKVIALARILCPESNIPSTTALATVNIEQGRELGLMRGANVVMPNLTPPAYRQRYEIYPSKACVRETSEDCRICLGARIRSIGRSVGSGPGPRIRRKVQGGEEMLSTQKRLEEVRLPGIMDWPISRQME
jgi:biotin synthase